EDDEARRDATGELQRVFPAGRAEERIAGSIEMCLKHDELVDIVIDPQDHGFSARAAHGTAPAEAGARSRKRAATASSDGRQAVRSSIASARAPAISPARHARSSARPCPERRIAPILPQLLARSCASCWTPERLALPARVSMRSRRAEVAVIQERTSPSNSRGGMIC